MTQLPVRCHLLIGPPGSGKTTVAHKLAILIQGVNGEPALVLSTDAIRAELFSNAAIQGPWDEIRAVLLKRLHAAVDAGRPVIIDATHARRSWRLNYTQALQLPRPVEWIGWWLKTPLSQCKAWALNRERPVPEAVIEEFYASLNYRFFKPQRAEGFAAVVEVDPAAGEGSESHLAKELSKLDGSIRNALNKQRAVTTQLHRYSRLLDVERLLFLLRLLTTFNGLDDSDPATAAELLKICNPPPQGDLAERAAAYLLSWKEVHGGNSDCYGDVEAIRGDLAWLETNGFTSLSGENREPIDCSDAVLGEISSVHGGYPALAQRPIFRRVFTLLRHILQEPYDAPNPEQEKRIAKRQKAEPAPQAAAQEFPGPRPKRVRRSSTEFSPLYRYLIRNLSEIEIDGSYAEDEEAVLRHDVEHVLTPYGFLPKVKGRPHSRRHGYAIGTAVLSADQLLQVHAQLKASLDRLSDQSQKPLLLQLEQRLQRAGILSPDGTPDRRRQPRRTMAHRSITEEKAGTLSTPELTSRVERAIRDRRRVLLRHLPDVVDEKQKMRGNDGSFRAWPLQLIFHNISWYLAFETFQIGRADGLGLIRVLRLDRLVLTKEDGNVRRASEQEHAHALERLERLMDVCGGVYFGQSIDEQLKVMHPSMGRDVKLPYQLLRFSCTYRVFNLIRETPRRYPFEHIAFSRPIPGDGIKDPGTRSILTPNPAGDSHPYPVEFRLPHWTVQHDWDLHNWLFRWGAGIRIEHPTELRDKQLQQAREVVELYRDDTAEA